jgi:hypothetical protein
VLKEEEEAGWAEWAKRPNRPTGRLGRVGPVRPAGPKGRTGQRGYWAEIKRENLFRIKIRYLNLPRLWKFVQGDFGGILTQ